VGAFVTEDLSKGITGASVLNLQTNMWSDYVVDGGTKYDFMSSFGVFFPAVITLS
jgi:hypothetical protein